MKYSATLLTIACLFAISISQTVKYPMIVYSEAAFSETKESSGAVHTHDVMDKLSESLKSANSHKLLLIVRDGFSSKELVMNAKKFQTLKEMIKSHSSVFTNLRQPFDFQAVKSEFHDTLHYDVTSINEASPLSQKILADFSSTGEENKVIIVEVKETVSMDDFDKLISTLKAEVLKKNEETVIAVSGREGVATAERMMNLQQTESNQQQKTLQQTDILNYYSINYYLSPNIATGLFVSFFMIFFLIFGFIQIYNLQTPTYFATQNIDFGKIEK